MHTGMHRIFLLIALVVATWTVTGCIVAPRGYYGPRHVVVVHEHPRWHR